MVEEVSPESKVYVKEEIEKMRKEFKEDLEKAQSKVTRIFTTVALIVGLLTGLGVYGSAKSLINSTIDAKVGPAIDNKLGTMTGEQIQAKEKELLSLVERGNISYNRIEEIKANAQKNTPMLMQLDISNQDLAAKNLSTLLKLESFDKSTDPNGYVWIGDILLQWGTVINTDAPKEYDFPIPFPKECFSAVPNVKRKNGTAPIYIENWGKKQFSIHRHRDSSDRLEHINYMAIGH